MSGRLPKKRVHQLAEEFALPSKELISILDGLGLRGKKPQSSLEDDEVAKIRAELEQVRKPRVILGSERIVAERVVTEGAERGQPVAKEEVVESRVQMNVIRRRTKRVDLPVSQAGLAPEVREEAPPLHGRERVFEEPAPAGPLEQQELAELEEETGAPTFTVEDFEREPEPTGRQSQDEGAESLARAEQEPPSEEPPGEELQVAPENGVAASVPKEAPEEEDKELKPTAPSLFDAQIGPGLKVLGRIDLKQLKPGPVEEKPAAEPAAPSVTDGQAAVTPTPQTEEPKPFKRKKRKIIKKQDLLELREQDVRHGKVPRKKRALPGKELRKTEITVPKAIKRIIRISEGITVAEMARIIGVKAGEVIKKAMGLGIMATINQVLDAEVAALVASDFGYQVENVAFDAEGTLEVAHESGEADVTLVKRPPVIAVMGHVDHGKTSLLDAIRETHVTAGEAGGITQHIGAYTVEVRGSRVTFLDTPGHEAFTAMRARGAKVTDLVVLVTAADDGVMPQTVEAINHARAADVPLLVCINKIDKPEANVERVKKQLADRGVLVEEWGGQIVCVPVSAKTREGIPHLLEMILLQAEVLDLKANPNKLARGTIIEAKLDKGRGPVATVLVQEGTLKGGNPFVCGVHYGRVRAMIDDKGKKVEEAEPSTPVEILGFQGVPEAGDSFIALTDEGKARQVAQHRAEKMRQAGMVKTSKVSLEELYEQIRAGDVKELRLVLKTDVQGSLEALQEALGKLSSEEVRLRIIHGSAGGISESDVLLAAASNALIIGFNVRPESKAAALAESERVEIRLYTIIYEVLNDIRSALEGLLEPIYREQVHGRLEIRKIFTIGGVGSVAGCYMTEGKISRSHPVRLIRDNVVVHTGRLASLKRFKDDVREVVAGYECGASLEGYTDVKIGDIIESYELVPVVRKLEAEKAQRVETR